MATEPVYCIGDRFIFPALDKDAQYMLVDNGSDDSDNMAVGLVELNSGRLQYIRPSLAPEYPHKWVPVGHIFQITQAELDKIFEGDSFIRVARSSIPARLARTKQAIATSGTFAESLA